MTPESLVGLLAEPERLRAFAAVVLGARTVADVRAAAGLDERAAGRALLRLTTGGLIESTAGVYQPVPEVFRQLARTAAPARTGPSSEHGYADERVEAVVRKFVRDGRLIGMPAQAGRRQVILEHIVQSFEPGRTYSEAEVNAILRAWTEAPRPPSPTDHVTVRRYLVDAGLLSREGNNYWRSGGWVDVLGG